MLLRQWCRRWCRWWWCGRRVKEALQHGFHLGEPRVHLGIQVGHHVGLQVAELLKRVGAHLIQPRGEGARVGGRVAVGAVGVQVALVLATSSWGKSLAVVHAALVCSSRTRQAAAMS